MKSSASLRTQLLLRKSIERRRIEALGGEPSIESDPLEFIERQRALEHIAELEGALAVRVDDALDFRLDGRGVYDHGITFSRFSVVVPPLGKTLRYMARDIAALDRDLDIPGQDIARVAEPVLLESLPPGSFGIRIVRAPVPEQMSFGGAPSLFERTAERFIGIFRTARESREPSSVLESVSGLRFNSLKGMRDLALALTAGGTTRVSWRGEEVVAVTPGTAGVVFEALETARIEDDDREVTGELIGGDLADARFHIRARDPETGRQREYRGGVEPAVVGTLRELAFGSIVTAVLTVTTTESEYFASPRETYVLTSVRLGSHELPA